jgi:hypothetical protein
VIDAGCFLWLRHNAHPLRGHPVRVRSSVSAKLGRSDVGHI